MGSIAHSLPTLAKAQVSMPPAIAVYGLMFYLSSVVRYKPGILDPSRHRDYVWVLESLCAASKLGLVCAAADSISGSWHSYGISLRG